MKTACRWAALLVLALAVAMSSANSFTAAQELSGQSADPKVDLNEIPQPDLAGVDQPVQEQIRASRAALAATLARSNASSTEKATAFGTLGEIYQAYGFNEAALASYQNAARLEPQSFRWQYYAGYLHQLDGDTESALRKYQRALTLKPNSATTMLRLANLELGANHLESAKSWFAKSMAQQNPSAAAAMTGLGKIALIEHRYPAALNYFKEALGREPQASTIHYQLAMTYRALGDLRQMQENMQARGEVEPTIHDPLLDEIRVLKQGKVGLLERGSAAIRQKRFSDAIAVYRQLVKIDPSAISYMYLGVALAKAGQGSEALQQYTHASQLDPNNAPVQYNIGILLIDAGKEELAIPHFQEAIRLDPALSDYHFQLANLLMRRKQDEEAGREYGIVTSLEPHNGFARLMQAMASVQAGAYSQALTLLEEASVALPKDPDIANALARLLAAAPDPAVRNENRGLQIIESLVRSQQGDSLEEGITLAMALAATGRFQEAAAIQRAIIHEVEKSQEADLVRLLGQNLDLYEREKPCRRPWVSEDPIFTPVPNKPQL
jgi:tetratricopeptide (TPR) repeat protein